MVFVTDYKGFNHGKKERRSLKKGGMDYRRINKILLSKELLFGRH